MKITRTITIDGKDSSEYAQIVQHMDNLKNQYPEWTISKDPILNRVTAVKIETLEQIQ